MRYPLDYVKGVEVPSVTLGVNMDPVAEPPVAETKTETIADPETPLVEDVIVLDTFSDGTDPTERDGEIGAHWTINYDFGGTAPEDGQLFLIADGYVRRTTFDEAPGTGNGAAIMYPSGEIPEGATRFYVAFKVKFVLPEGDYSGSYAELYEKATDGGNAFQLLVVGNPEYGTPGSHITVITDTSGTNVPFVAVSEQEYTVRVDVNGTNLRLSVDGRFLIAWTRSALPIGPFGLDMQDIGQDGQVRVSEFKIAVPPQTPQE